MLQPSNNFGVAGCNSMSPASLLDRRTELPIFDFGQWLILLSHACIPPLPFNARSIPPRMSAEMQENVFLVPFYPSCLPLNSVIVVLHPATKYDALSRHASVQRFGRVV
jgi:hypothetical protein